MRRYTHTHRVTFDETNLVGNVYFAHYVHWQGHCREMFLSDCAPSVITALQEGSLAMVTVSCSVDYYAECFALDTIVIRMALQAMSGNRITMGFEFDRAGQLVATGRQTVACMAATPDGMVPTEVPVDLARALEAYR